jgi:hypothetical protein
MEKSKKCPSYRKGEKLQNNIFLNNIIKEYSLIRTQFNPKIKSPNIFISKLEHRLKDYYCNLIVK